jgi:hypothetical protein
MLYIYTIENHVVTISKSSSSGAVRLSLVGQEISELGNCSISCILLVYGRRMGPSLIQA